MSQRLDDHSFGLVIAAATDTDKARLLSTSAHHAASWLTVVPSVGLGHQTAVKWWAAFLEDQDPHVQKAQLAPHSYC